jgi:hypothetical protein
MLVSDFFKQNGSALSFAALIIGAVCLFVLNVPIGSQITTAKIVRYWNAPSRHNAVSLVVFIELQNGQVTTASRRSGQKLPQIGESIKVRQEKYLFFGEGFVIVE